MADAQQLVTQTQRTCHFGGRWQERNNASSHYHCPLIRSASQPSCKKQTASALLLSNRTTARPARSSRTTHCPCTQNTRLVSSCRKGEEQQSAGSTLAFPTEGEMTASVKGFGRRPIATAREGTGAVVRKRPGKEPAGS